MFLGRPYLGKNFLSGKPTWEVYPDLLQKFLIILFEDTLFVWNRPNLVLGLDGLCRKRIFH